MSTMIANESTKKPLEVLSILESFYFADQFQTMLAALFLKLTKYAWFRRLVWKPIYEMVARKYKAHQWYFMNYGYTPFDYEEPLELQEKDEINRYQIQLYHFLAIKVPVEGSDMLEVGSGRGGGASYIAEYLKPNSMTGMDLAQNAVDLSNRDHNQPNLRYIQGNAEKIPLDDHCMDAVINVESCHAYGSVPNFLSEVKRVLRPDGILVLTDLRGHEGMDKLREQINSCGMKVLEEEDITDNVVRAIEEEEPLKKKRIEENLPKSMWNAFREFGGATNSQIHLQLKSRDLIYTRFVLKNSL